MPNVMRTPEGRSYNTYKGPIVARGDSWFSYEGRVLGESVIVSAGKDIIDNLRERGYDIRNFSRAGAKLIELVDQQNTYPDLATTDEVIAEVKDLQPRVVLFSGGGNDVSGDQFEEYLNQDANPTIVNERKLTQNIARFRGYIEQFIQMVLNVSPRSHIIMHGYAYGHPSGTPVTTGLARRLGEDLNNDGFADWTGPWLKPALDKKNIMDVAQREASVRILMDAYNEMLHDVAKANKRFHTIDLRGQFTPADWANEYHLYDAAFKRVAEFFHQDIQRMVNGNPYLDLKPKN